MHHLRMFAICARNKKKYLVCYLFNFIDIHNATSSIEIGADHAMPLLYHPHMIHVYIAFVKIIHLHFFLVNMNVNHMIHEEIHDFIKEIPLYQSFTWVWVYHFR